MQDDQIVNTPVNTEQLTAMWNFHKQDIKELHGEI